ncbi:hypothetical protein DFH06DRAFT_1441267 [Mycena polygramma]|nr:hypothetical protein DFH06DRAFT_1441267 [Mycena polygramma]
MSEVHRIRMSPSDAYEPGTRAQISDSERLVAVTTQPLPSCHDNFTTPPRSPPVVFASIPSDATFEVLTRRAKPSFDSAVSTGVTPLNLDSFAAFMLNGGNEWGPLLDVARKNRRTCRLTQQAGHLTCLGTTLPCTPYLISNQVFQDDFKLPSPRLGTPGFSSHARLRWHTSGLVDTRSKLPRAHTSEHRNDAFLHASSTTSSPMALRCRRPDIRASGASTKAKTITIHIEDSTLLPKQLQWTLAGEQHTDCLAPPSPAPAARAEWGLEWKMEIGHLILGSSDSSRWVARATRAGRLVYNYILHSAGSVLGCSLTHRKSGVDNSSGFLAHRRVSLTLWAEVFPPNWVKSEALRIQVLPLLTQFAIPSHSQLSPASSSGLYITARDARNTPFNSPEFILQKQSLSIHTTHVVLRSETETPAMASSSNTLYTCTRHSTEASWIKVEEHSQVLMTWLLSPRVSLVRPNISLLLEDFGGGKKTPDRSAQRSPLKCMLLWMVNGMPLQENPATPATGPAYRTSLIFYSLNSFREPKAPLGLYVPTYSTIIRSVPPLEIVELSQFCVQNTFNRVIKTQNHNHNRLIIDVKAPLEELLQAIMELKDSEDDSE